jgi:hypothetical protein
VLEDADKLQAEGSIFKIYNAEFKVDVFFAVPQTHNHPLPADLADLYLKTDVSSCVGWWWSEVRRGGLRRGLPELKRAVPCRAV